MKIRNGFVSNSSSSSFICEVCGQDASGWDMSLSDAEMYECENGHVFCEDHALSYGSEKEICIQLIKSSIEKWKERILENPNNVDYKNYLKGDEDLLKQVEETTEDDDFDFDNLMDELEFRYSVPAKYCPICQMNHVTDEDMVSYLFKKYDINEDDVKAEIKSTFNSYKEFKNYKN